MENTKSVSNWKIFWKSVWVGIIAGLISGMVKIGWKRFYHQEQLLEM